MMMLCPKCHATFNQASFRSWVLEVTGKIKINNNGIPIIVGPLNTVCAIKKNNELNSPLAALNCPNCGHSAYIKEFKIVYTCCLTGNVTNIHVSTNVGKVYISPELDIQLVLDIFANVNWDNCRLLLLQNGL